MNYEVVLHLNVVVHRMKKKNRLRIKQIGLLLKKKKRIITIISCIIL